MTTYTGLKFINLAPLALDSVNNRATITGQLVVNGSQVLKRTATATSYTALLTDYLIAVTSTASSRTISLPAASTASGIVYIIKDESGGAGTNNIVINPDGSETIEGALTYALSTNYGSITIYCNGTTWFVM